MEKNSRQSVVEPTPHDKLNYGISRKPAPGYTWNPILRIARNTRCLCGSGEKFKVCCYDYVPDYVTLKEAEDYQLQITQGTMRWRRPTPKTKEGEGLEGCALDFSETLLKILSPFKAWKLEHHARRWQGHWVDECYTCCVWDGETWSGVMTANTPEEAAIDAIEGLRVRLATAHVFEKPKK